MNPPPATRASIVPSRLHFPVALRQNLTSTHLFLTKDFKSWIRAGRLTDPSLDERDVVIFPETIGGKWVTLHRPMQWHGAGFSNAQPAIWIAATDDVLGWKQLKLLAKAEFDWEMKVGATTRHSALRMAGCKFTTRSGPTSTIGWGPCCSTWRIHSVSPIAPGFRSTSRTRNGRPRVSITVSAFLAAHAVLNGVYHLYDGGGDVVCGLATAPLDGFLQSLPTQPVP